MRKKLYRTILCAAGLICLLTGCGRELEDREFPSLLTVTETPLEDVLEKKQEKSSKYMDYGQVKSVLILESIAKDERQLKDVLVYLEAHPAFARNILVFVGNKETLEQADIQADEAGDLLEDFYKNNPALGKHDGVTLGEMMDYLHNGETIEVPLIILREGEVTVGGSVELEKEVVEAGSSPVWRSAE